MRSMWWLAAGIALVWGGSALAAPKPNVILIVADDLGYGELGCYGQSKIQTPHLDRMAAEGLRFTQFYSGSPVCAPSRCCLMTGKHGGHAWIRDNRSVGKEGQAPVPTSEVMLPELLKREGYATGAMGKWGLGPPGSESDPVKRGFDLFFGYNCQAHAHYYYPKYLWRNTARVEYPDNQIRTGKQHSHDLFEQEALAFVEKQRDRPFFLFLPLTLPHLALQAEPSWLKPYLAKKWEDPAYDGKKGYSPHPTPRAAYAAMITRLDQTVGRLREKLHELDLDKNTLVLFTSDNGATHDVGGVDTNFFQSVGKLRGRKGSVYEGGLRVPLLACWPGTIAPGKVSEHVAYFPDLLPTLMDVVGASSRIPPGVDGISFLPTLRGKTQPAHAQLVWEFQGYGGQQAVRVGEWKGVRRGLMKGPVALELYNLREDPEESRNVAADHPEMVRKLEAVLTAQHTPSRLFPLKGLSPR
ncbi:MAG: arylsulfatase [Gemmataceae bacterium]